MLQGRNHRTVVDPICPMERIVLNPRGPEWSHAHAVIVAVEGDAALGDAKPRADADPLGIVGNPVLDLGNPSDEAETVGDSLPDPSPRGNAEGGVTSVATVVSVGTVPAAPPSVVGGPIGSSNTRIMQSGSTRSPKPTVPRSALPTSIRIAGSGAHWPDAGSNSVEPMIGPRHGFHRPHAAARAVGAGAVELDRGGVGCCSETYGYQTYS